MANQTKYLLTVDDQTGAVTKVQRVGESGELTDVPRSWLSVELRVRAPEQASSPEVVPTGGGHIDSVRRTGAADVVPTGGGNKSTKK